LDGPRDIFRLLAPGRVCVVVGMNNQTGFKVLRCVLTTRARNEAVFIDKNPASMAAYRYSRLNA
jgi:hypothetical protein